VTVSEVSYQTVSEITPESTRAALSAFNIMANDNHERVARGLRLSELSGGAMLNKRGSLFFGALEKQVRLGRISLSWMQVFTTVEYQRG
jgi:hypothetical protein